nr:hypothetical protein [Tanacetum cinerariifolium]
VVEVVGVCESGGGRQGSGESVVKGMTGKPVVGATVDGLNVGGRRLSLGHLSHLVPQLAKD